MHKEKIKGNARGFRGAIGKLTCELLTPVFQKKEFLCSRLMFDWPFIVGKGIASYTFPEKIIDAGQKQHFLYLRACSEKSLEISYSVSEIKEKVNQYMGYKAIDRIILRQSIFTQHPIKDASSDSSSIFEQSLLSDEQLPSKIKSKFSQGAPTPLDEVLKKFSKTLVTKKQQK